MMIIIKKKKTFDTRKSSILFLSKQLFSIHSYKRTKTHHRHINEKGAETKG